MRLYSARRPRTSLCPRSCQGRRSHSRSLNSQTRRSSEGLTWILICHSSKTRLSSDARNKRTSALQLWPIGSPLLFLRIAQSSSFGDTIILLHTVMINVPSVRRSRPDPKINHRVKLRYLKSMWSSPSRCSLSASKVGMGLLGKSSETKGLS